MQPEPYNIKTVHGNEYAEAILQLIDSAFVTIDIAMFDWRWYDQDPSNPIQLINQAIVRAVRRGVRVRAVTSSQTIVNILKSVGVDAKKKTGSGLMHAKLIIVDEYHYSIGSHNLTDSAQHKNVETSMIVSDMTSAREHLKYFLAVWQ